MSLLSLPLEVIEAVIESTLRTLGIREATLLRRVCKTFDTSIQRAIYALPTFEGEDVPRSDPLARDPRMSKAMVASLILAKMRTADAEARVLCVEINRTVDFLLDSFAQKNTELRTEYTEALAAAAANSLFLHDVVSHLAPTRGSAPSASRILDNALVAAASASQVSTVERILDMGAEPMSKTALFGEPLSAAARTGSTPVVLLLLDRTEVGESLSSWFWPWFRQMNALAAGASAGSEEVVRTLLNPKYGLLRSSSLYDHAVKVAAQNGHEPVMDILLQYRTPRPPYPLVDEVRFRLDILRTAIEHSCERIVRKILADDPTAFSDAFSLLLEDAIRCGRVRIVELLLSRMFAYAHETPSYPSSLYWAARRGNRECLDTLIDFRGGVDLALTCDALAGAAFSSNKELMPHLLKRYAVTLADDRIVKKLERTTPANFTDAVHLLLDAHLDYIKSHSGKPPRALKKRRRLVAAQAHCTDSQQWSQIPHYEPGEVPLLLRVASESGDLDKVDEILSRYTTAHPDHDLGGFQNARDAAVRSNHIGVLAYLCAHIPGPLNSEVAARAKSPAIFQVYMDFGWDINTPLSERSPPALSHVVDDEHVTRFLLDHGADPNARCGWDNTPLSGAVCAASTSTIKLLFGRGGTVEKGQLLHFAATRGGSDDLDVIGLLLDLGAPINKRMYEDDPPSWRYHRWLGMGTPLGRAARDGRAEVVSFLLERGADRTIRDSRGYTPLEAAEESGHEEVVRVLST